MICVGGLCAGQRHVAPQDERYDQKVLARVPASVPAWNGYIMEAEPRVHARYVPMAFWGTLPGSEKPVATWLLRHESLEPWNVLGELLKVYAERRDEGQSTTEGGLTANPATVSQKAESETSSGGPERPREVEA
jgi:hypothetical protein